ncbi:GTPase HflX [Streptococcus sp. DD12]|uniref:GTPase HflX n=1 Tax=Streptococcus sp. DD12 TaxID=1777880 RepID=UPI0007961886|nr:GTPase HflX [Streptococcus sp. DD12]KXT76304.1 GTP-binding protein HflX [Streptococcus sp. DD12]
MFETKLSPERVLLVHVVLPESQRWEMSLAELERLAQTAGGQVVGSVIQRKNVIDAKSFVGSGKLDQLRQEVEDNAIDTVIVNNRLSPRQNMVLEEALDCKVIDRMQLILDIFAMRARSYEGKLQVHLAQLKYLLPRLVGKGIMLSRQAGGIGSRGPGESQLELNRRSIRHQITDIERQLKVVEKQRQQGREQRQQSSVFKIGLIGYTNAGKSTMMNCLTQDDQYEADELFATLDATTKKIHIQGAFEATLTDTVGFIQDLPTELIAAFKSTLEESRDCDLLLHVVDASDPDFREQEVVVEQLLDEVDMGTIPRLTIYNKLDKVSLFAPDRFPHATLSCKAKDSHKQIKTILVRELKHLFSPFQITCPVEEVYRLYELSRWAILDQDELGNFSETITGYIADKNKWRLERFYDRLS